jgi:hypothetical protein
VKTLENKNLEDKEEIAKITLRLILCKHSINVADGLNYGHANYRNL